jgi:dipeptidyl aminopeptidase/acylaminoacyl peptidase
VDLKKFAASFGRNATRRALKESSIDLGASAGLRLLLAGVALMGHAGFAQKTAPADLPGDRAYQTIAGIYKQQLRVAQISHVALSRDGEYLAWAVVVPGTGKHRVYFAPLRKPESAAPLTVGSTSQECDEDAPEWSPDGSQVALLSDCDSPGQLQVFVIGVGNPQGRAKQLTQLSGYLSSLQWAPDGRRIAFLFVEKASRTPSPMAAENRAVGVIDDLAEVEIQRVAIVDPSQAAMRQITPPGLYIFEFDWSPDGKTLLYTAAPPPGDDNWYIAQLYTQQVNGGAPLSIYKPQLQIALPRWSPDGKSVAFIEGLMSDEGATGGEIYQLSREGGKPRDLTPGRASTPSWYCWRSDTEMLFTEFTGGSTAISSLELGDRSARVLWQKGETVQATSVATSLSTTGPNGPPTLAFMRTSWSLLPEVWAGQVDDLKQITHLNAGISIPFPRCENAAWESGGNSVQGWLLFPEGYDPSKKYPMIVSVHGGPAWISTPTWKDDDFNVTLFTNLGYFVLVPNIRGSYGNGEKFTQANRRDWGFGDLDDMVAGVDSVVKRYPVDTNRVGVIGWSYGASTAMMAAVRTHRFRAAVAGAGAVDMLSYYGENSIDKWMIAYFGASVYDDPAAYARCSAITYVKNAKTPTLLLVGERDGEAPPPQSFEFWHALKELNVPTQLVVYADEGHGFAKEEDRIDLTARAFRWFERYMKPD